MARRAAFLAQRVFASDLIYVEPVFFGFNLITGVSERDDTEAHEHPPIAKVPKVGYEQPGSAQKPNRTGRKRTHPSGTLKDVNLSPVSSFFALGIPRGILPVPAFDFVVPEVASLVYFWFAS